MLVRLSNSSIHVSELSFFVLPLFTTDFTATLGHGRSAKLRQFPVTLAYAITDYKCQGQTYDSVLVDLAKPSGVG